MWIRPDDKKIFYSGRIDWSEKVAPVFVFPATYAQMCFTGKTVRIHIKNKSAYWNNYVGYILDGVQGKALLPEDGETVIELKVQKRQVPEVDSHELMIFKRQDACHEMAFLGVELDEGEGLLELPETSKPFFRKIEVYGDSVSAGEVSEAVDFVGNRIRSMMDSIQTAGILMHG